MQKYLSEAEISPKGGDTYSRKVVKFARAISRHLIVRYSWNLHQTILRKKIHKWRNFHEYWVKAHWAIQIPLLGQPPISHTLTLTFFFRYRHLDITQKLKFESFWNLKCMFITSIVTHKQNFRPLAWKKILHVQMRAGAPNNDLDISDSLQTKINILSNS